MEIDIFRYQILFYMKALLTVLFICSFSLSLAQNNIFYFKKSGRQVYQRDSADYTRVFLPPADGSPLFTVNEFYINGTPKLSGKASNFDPMKLEGTCTTFYENGNKKEVLNYDKGILMGEQSYYYTNGKIRTVLEYLAEKVPTPANMIMGRSYLVKSCLDSTGTALIANGNGYYKGLGLPSGSVYEEGTIKEGRREGTWKGSIKRMTFEEKYENGTLLSGTLTDRNGETHNYTKYRETMIQHLYDLMVYLSVPAALVITFDMKLKSSCTK
jgi:antitoxin component YwqK of YwqJK toxin-antitoxin module